MMMSASGQKRRRFEISMSALPPKKDIRGRCLDVRKVPKAYVAHRSATAQHRGKHALDRLPGLPEIVARRR